MPRIARCARINESTLEIDDCNLREIFTVLDHAFKLVLHMDIPSRYTIEQPNKVIIHGVDTTLWNARASLFANAQDHLSLCPVIARHARHSSICAIIDPLLSPPRLGTLLALPCVSLTLRCSRPTLCIANAQDDVIKFIIIKTVVAWRYQFVVPYHPSKTEFDAVRQLPKNVKSTFFLQEPIQRHRLLLVESQEGEHIGYKRSAYIHEYTPQQRGTDHNTAILLLKLFQAYEGAPIGSPYRYNIHDVNYPLVKGLTNVMYL
jgi:hypothetical protein